MSPDTDPEMRRRLDEVPVPPHADGFWAALRDDLDPGASPVHLADARRERRTPRRWASAAAAVALVVAGVVVASALDDDGAVPVTSDPGPVPTAPSTTLSSDVGALGPDGEPVAIGSGQVVAVSPDGAWLYVSAGHPDGGLGCEGAPRQSLFVQPTGGGERRLATDTPLDVGGAATMQFGPGGSAAVLTQCESFLGGLVAGTIGPDGALGDVVDLPVDGISAIVDFAWIRPGVVVATTYGLGAEEVAPGESGRALVEFDVGADTVTSLLTTGLISIDVAGDGTLVSRDDVGTIRVGDEVIGSEGSVFDVVVSDDGRYVATTGEKGVNVYDRQTGAEERLSDEPGFTLSLLDTGDLVFSTRDDQDVATITAVRLGAVGSGDHAVGTLFSDQGLGRMTYSDIAADGSQVFVSYLADAPLPLLVRQTLVR